MRFIGVIAVVQVIQIYTASKIFTTNDDEPLTEAAANIANRCFGISKRWSELLVVNERDSHRILEKIHQESITSNSILSLDATERYQLVRPTEYNRDGDSIQWQTSKPSSVIISTRSLEELNAILSSLKNHVQRIWRPKSHFLVVLEIGCNVTEVNDMFKAIWGYWILNAVILCSSAIATVRNQSEIELYTFNPYSADHSPQWNMIIDETVEVSIIPGNFNHSWYVFKQGFAKISFSDNCGGIFFEKTMNLDGYVIPVSIFDPGFLFNANSTIPAYFEVDNRILRTIAGRLRFDIAQVLNENSITSARVFKNGSFVGSLEDVRQERSHLMPATRDMNRLPGLGLTYPHTTFGVCFATRVIGPLPQWMNMATAKHIWIGLGLCLMSLILVLYLQNKPYGIVSAFLDAERFIVGSSIINSPKAIKYRIILGSIFLVLLVLDGSIRGRFTSILTLPRPYPNLDTLEQLKEQNVEIYGHFFFLNSITDPELKARFNSTVLFRECVDALERGGHQRACFTMCTISKLWTINTTILHESSVPVQSGYVAFVTAKHWPLTNRYSHEVKKLVESGIHEKWQSDVYRKFEMNTWKQRRAAVPPYVRPIKLNDLLPAFVLLFAGLLAALIIFASEMKGERHSSY